MIKGQCENCRKYGSVACGQAIIFNGYPCGRYENVGVNPQPSGNPYTGSNPYVGGNPQPSSNPYTGSNPYSGGNPYPPQPRTNNDSFWNNLFSFKGRNRRSLFWYTSFLSTTIYFVIIFVMGGLLGGDIIPGIASIMSIPMLWVSFANIAKRCHDLGKSATWILCLFIPLINLIFIFYLAFAPGDKFANQYGPSPY